MKTIRNIASLFLAFAVVTAALHAEKTAAGPKGGRLLETGPDRTEFFVNPDRKVEVNFYDASLKPAAPGTRTVTVTAEPSGARTRLDLDQTATGYVSKTALPTGEPYRIVVQVRAAPDAKPQNFRIDFNLATCGECQHAEYACICEGH